MSSPPDQSAEIYVDVYYDPFDYDAYYASLDKQPFEFNEENRSRIIELFDLQTSIRLHDLKLLDYVYTSLQKCDPERFKEEDELIMDDLINMSVRWKFWNTSNLYRNDILNDLYGIQQHLVPIWVILKSADGL